MPGLLSAGLRTRRMGAWCLWGAALLVASVAGCDTFRGLLRPQPQPRVEHWQALGDLEYLEVIPKGPGAAARLPMVVIVHGMGDRPRAEWIKPDAPKVRYVMPRGPLPYGDGFSWFRYRVGDANPSLPGEVEAAVGRLAGALRGLLRQKATRGRAVLSGFSQGGILSYGIALRHPGVVELALPVSGWLPESLWPDRPAPGRRQPPIRGSHGTHDRTVPFDPTRRMVRSLKARGFDIDLAAFPGVGHRVSDAMRDRMEKLMLEGIARVQR